MKINKYTKGTHKMFFFIFLEEKRDRKTITSTRRKQKKPWMRSNDWPRSTIEFFFRYLRLTKVHTR